ncbi:MAG: hypothetical protein ACRDRL_09975 [Sciscionella sp.]
MVTPGPDPSESQSRAPDTGEFLSAAREGRFAVSAEGVEPLVSLLRRHHDELSGLRDSLHAVGEPSRLGGAPIAYAVGQLSAAAGGGDAQSLAPAVTGYQRSLDEAAEGLNAALRAYLLAEDEIARDTRRAQGGGG